MKLDAGVGGERGDLRRHFFIFFLRAKRARKIWNKLPRKVDERPGVEASTIFREVSVSLLNLLHFNFIFVSNFDHIFFHVFRKPYEIGIFYYLLFFFLHKIPACPHLCNFALTSTHQRGSREDVEKMRDEFSHFVCQRNFLYYCGNILNRNLEKNAHRNDESVSVRGAHFKPRCNFLPSYCIMLLLGHERL